MGSLDTWREYFGRGESDIFGIIEHAIMVAAADCPSEFKSRRDGIAQLLFSCRVSRCVGCDHVEVCVGGEEGGVKKVDGGGGVVDEVLRLKGVLFNKDDEPHAVLFDSLRKLESMSMTVEMLKSTEIGKAVTGLRKHTSEKISKLAKALIVEWKEMVDEWMNIPKETAVKKEQEWTPESENLSAVEEEEPIFPFPPHDLDFFAREPTDFELSQILDGLDCDGNLLSDFALAEEPIHEWKVQSGERSRPDDANEANVVGRYNNNNHLMKREDADGADEVNVVGRYNNNNHLTRREEADVRREKQSVTEFDEQRRQPKQSREQVVPAPQRKPLISEQRLKLAGPRRQDNLKDLDADAKFEFAKRKLQESYQNHEKAKRQRTIQVLETIPTQGKPKKPLFKKPVRR